jgi:predicted XRE-type DNA-binding protein
MSASNPIAWEDLRSEFGFTPEEEAEMAAARSRLLTEVRAHRLAEIRRGMGETQVTVAHRMGVTQARVSAIERACHGRGADHGGTAPSSGTAPPSPSHSSAVSGRSSS